VVPHGHALVEVHDQDRDRAGIEQRPQGVAGDLELAREVACSLFGAAQRAKRDDMRDRQDPGRGRPAAQLDRRRALATTQDQLVVEAQLGHPVAQRRVGRRSATEQPAELVVALEDPTSRVEQTGAEASGRRMGISGLTQVRSG